MAKKIGTNKLHFEQINLTLIYIENNFNRELTVEELAKVSGYSLFHFHKIFKEIVKQNVNSYIRNVRLEKASNLLLYNQHQTIEEIATLVGFSTATGFSATFKKKFNLTPKEWRKGGYEKKSYKNSHNMVSLIEINEDIEIGEPTIVNEAKIPIIYMRSYGYKDDMSKEWNFIIEWAKKVGALTESSRYIGLFHNHPSFKPYNKARYLTCIETKSNTFINGSIGKCTISSGKFARFSFNCKHSELYKMMHLAYMKWLSNSIYEVRNFPAYVEYKNPENLLLNATLETDFYMPIQLKI